VRSTVVSSDELENENYPANLFGSFSSLGHNLIEKADGAFGFTNGVSGDICGTMASPIDPLLGPLTNNGGSTLTMSISNSSPCLNAGDDAILGPPYNFSADQRGSVRKSSTHVDIGSFEMDASALAPPTVLTLSASAGPINSNSATALLTFNGSANPAGTPARGWFQYGLTPSYGAFTGTNDLGSGTNSVTLSFSTPGMAAGFTYHYRAVAVNPVGTSYGADQTISLASLRAPGDLNGDGIVDQSELNTVLSNYWPNSPWLYMTNTAGLGTTMVQFALTNASAWNFSVLVSTNLTDWDFVGLASPLYQFTDPAATNAPQRYYRLRWP